jgi:hypothetical protein
MTFRYTYGSSGTGTGVVDITVTGVMVGQPTMDSVHFKSTNSGQRDVIASGDMIIPSGTFPAMLERSINTKIDSAWAKGAATGNQWVLVSSDYEMDSAFYWYTNQSLLPYAHALYDQTGLHDVNYFQSMIVGVSETFTDLSGSIYPNPVVNMLHINMPANIRSSYAIEIFNSQGQSVMKGNASLNRINVSFLQPGIYFLNLMDAGGKTSSVRFVKN